MEDVFWNTTILHTTAMTHHSKSALSKQRIHTGKTNTRQDIIVCYLARICPGYGGCFSSECIEPAYYVVHVSLPCAGNTEITDCHVYLRCFI